MLLSTSNINFAYKKIIYKDGKMSILAHLGL